MSFPAALATMDDRIHKRQVGVRLRQAREGLGFLVATEFCRAMDNLDKTKLSNWERGINYPDPAFILKLWRRHHVNADWIYLGEIAGLPHKLAASLLAAPAEASQERRAKGEAGSEP
jgi:hypothetical protein